MLQEGDALAETLVEDETLHEQVILKATGPSHAPALEKGKPPVAGAESRSTDPSRE